jgi:queuine/archaeosine tRNA-ribosyltransferase
MRSLNTQEPPAFRHGEFQEQLENDVQMKMDELAESSAETWEETKAEVETTMNELEGYYEEIVESIQS